MTNTSDPASIEQGVVERLSMIDRELSQCNVDLTTQSSRCPSTLATAEIDTPLKQCVYVHQKRLLKKVSCLLAKYKACIGDHELWKRLSSYHLTMDQVCHQKDSCSSMFVLSRFQLETIDRIMALHLEMKATFEALTMLEQRILCKFLPESVDHLSFPNPNEMNMEEDPKRLQQLKRSMLDHRVQSYETQLLAHEDQSRKEWTRLDKFCWDDGMVDGIPLLDFFKRYMIHRTKQDKRETRFKMIFFRSKLVRHRRWLPATQHTIGIWPQVMTDMSALPLTNAQLSYISSAGKKNN